MSCKGSNPPPKAEKPQYVARPFTQAKNISLPQKVVCKNCEAYVFPDVLKQGKWHGGCHRLPPTGNRDWTFVAPDDWCCSGIEKQIEKQED